MQVLLATCGAWHLPQTAKALAARGALAGLWTTERDRVGLPADKVRRCWPFALAMQPWYRLTSAPMVQRAFHAHFPLWRLWLRAQRYPPYDAVMSIMGLATEPFDHADKVGAKKILSCPNSHPVTLYGAWQRECDLWCPGERVPIPRRVFGRATRELERADLIEVLSLFCRESMIANGIPASKIFLNPFGVDTSLFQPRAAPPEKPRFIAVGTIGLRKGHQYLFRAFAQVRQACPEAELVCVGTYLSDFRREKPQWLGTFTHYPYLPHPELARLLQTATAFVLPSQEEGIPHALLEAMAAGLPILGTHEGGATTLVEDGVEGLILRGRDPQHIAAAMIRVATDRDLNRRMGEAAHRRGAIQNTWQDYGDRLLAECTARFGPGKSSG